MEKKQLNLHWTPTSVEPRERWMDGFGNVLIKFCFIIG